MSIRIEDIHRIDFSDVIDPQGEPIPPTSPGDILRHEFLEPLGLSANALSQAIKVPANRITAILNGRRAVTADTALRLARYFGTTPQFWMNLQKNYELRLALREEGPRILQEVQPRAA